MGPPVAGAGTVDSVVAAVAPTATR
jgi:hypothetical protein